MNAKDVIRFRIYPEEKRILEIMTRQERRNRSAMLRECLHEAAERRGIVHQGELLERSPQNRPD